MGGRAQERGSLSSCPRRAELYAALCARADAGHRSQQPGSSEPLRQALAAAPDVVAVDVPAEDLTLVDNLAAEEAELVADDTALATADVTPSATDSTEEVAGSTPSDQSVSAADATSSVQLPSVTAAVSVAAAGSLTPASVLFREIHSAIQIMAEVVDTYATSVGVALESMISTGGRR